MFPPSSSRLPAEREMAFLRQCISTVFRTICRKYTTGPMTLARCLSTAEGRTPTRNRRQHKKSSYSRAGGLGLRDVAPMPSNKACLFRRDDDRYHHIGGGILVSFDPPLPEV